MTSAMYSTSQLVRTPLQTLDVTHTHSLTHTHTGEGDLNHICDCLRTYHCHDLPWPRGMTSKLYELAWQELSWQFFSQFAYPSVQATAQVGIGFLMREIWQVCLCAGVFLNTAFS